MAISKIILNDETQMDITDTTATESDVLSGNVFYAANGVRSVGTYTPAQSDWEEDDSTDPAFILNKPPIIVGEGEESIVAGKLSPSNTAAVYTLTINGEANSNTFTYATEDTLPGSGLLKTYGLACYVKSSTTNVYKAIISIDKTNYTITLSSALDASAITDGTLTIYYYQHKAIGKYGSAEGQYTYSTGASSHAEGGGTKAIGQSSHSEGMTTVAEGSGCHAEGNSTIAKGTATHAEGASTVTSGTASHAEGNYTIATSNYQHAQGKYNIEDANGVYADIVGNGTSSARSNAYTLDWSGNGWFAGRVSVGVGPAGSMDVATKQYVDSQSTPTVIGSTNTDDSDYISPGWAVLYITDAPRNLIMSHTDNVYGQLFFNSWNVVLSAGLIVSNAVLYNGGLLCATLIGNADGWTFTVYPIQGALTFDSTPINNSTNPVTSGGVYTALSSKANSADIPSASSTAPLSDGTAAVGTSTAYARADHVHPVSSLSALSDTTVSSPSNGQVLIYNSTSSKWVNFTLTPSDIDAVAASNFANVLADTQAIFYELKPTSVENQFKVEEPFLTIYLSFSGSRKVYFVCPDNSTGDVTVFTIVNADIVNHTITLVSISTSIIERIMLQIDSNNTNNMIGSLEWINIPLPSSNTPLADGIAAAGILDTYARADHVHPKIPIDSTLSTTSENPVQNKVIQNALVNKLDFNTNYNPIPLDFPDPENPPATLDGATITCGLDFADILELYQLAIDTSFELLDIIQNHNFIVFHPFRINDANESIELFSIFDNTIYTITLEPNIDSGMTHGMIGTLHVKDSVTIDSALSSSSTNPVTNSAITTAIANNRGKVFYGVVDNTSTATAFTAQIPGITAYEEGLVIILKNGVVTSASGFTINVNGLGALPVYNNLGAASRETTIFNVAYTMMFVYENRVSGGDWLCYRGSDANTNTIGYQLRTNSMSLPMKSITYRYRLLFTSADGAHFVPANNTTSTNATASRAVCQDKIDPFGPIYYYSTTASVAANSRPSTANLWEQYTIALGYSFNRTGAALTLTPWVPVYVKCAPQTDGSAIIDSTTPYVQVLPTTADGKIYIFLGVAYSATNIELVPHHPVYCYRNGGIQEWTGIQAEIDTINTRIDGCVTTEELDDALANLPSGGGSTAPTLLGNTPVKLTEDANIKLNTSGSCTYTLESDTVADFDILHGTTVKATITFEDSVYKLKAGSDASAWYNTYIDIFVDGLTVGTAYTFVFDADGCTFNTSQHITVGHYILYDNSGNTLVTRGSTDSNSLNSYAFTASTTKVKLRWYPSISSYYSAGVSVATVNRIYINKAGTTEHTNIVNSSGSFTDTVELGSVSRGVTISSTPVAAVYKVASSGGGSSKPLEGKTIVVFGDSLIGMYRGETSATAYIKNVTGATVYNVGFGGCRMATHPTNGYAQFSMWALADAVASGVWTSQDQYASSGSDYFAEQLATLKSIDFNNVDYVVIHYGTNDFGGGVPLGFDSPSTDCTTFCGATRHSIETLLSAYPKLRIYISLPVYRYWESGGVITYAETYQNSQNVILMEYIAALSTIASEYYLPIIDGYHELGINRLNASTFLSDGTHHNAIGRRRFGEFIGSKIVSSM